MPHNGSGSVLRVKPDMNISYLHYSRQAHCPQAFRQARGAWPRAEPSHLAPCDGSCMHRELKCLVQATLCVDTHNLETEVLAAMLLHAEDCL